MKPMIKYMMIGLLVAAFAGFTVMGVAYAQGDDPRGRDALAELLGLTPEELREQLQDGKTIKELADEAGVDLDVYQQEIHLSRQENLESRIEEALANGDISQDQADWLLEGLEKGYLDGPFFGWEGGVAGGRPGVAGDRPSGMRGRGENAK